MLLHLALTGAAAAAAWPNYTSIAGRTGYFASFGNHRFNVTVPASAETPSSRQQLTARAVWRRSDAGWAGKAVYITAADHAPLSCSFVGTPSADAATFSFTPEVPLPTPPHSNSVGS